MPLSASNLCPPPRLWSFGMIIGIEYLPFSDETGYCDGACQPGFKCVLITDAQELESKQLPSPRTLAYKYFRVVVFFLLLWFTFIYFFTADFEEIVQSSLEGSTVTQRERLICFYFSPSFCRASVLMS